MSLFYSAEFHVANNKSIVQQKHTLSPLPSRITTSILRISEKTNNIFLAVSIYWSEERTEFQIWTWTFDVNMSQTEERESKKTWYLMYEF